MASVATTKKPTTPSRGEARASAFLQAAAQVFTEKGYSAATLDDVIALSGGSRQTLYSKFGGKRGLFEAIVAHLCQEVIQPDTLALPASDMTPEIVLHGIGRRMLDIMLSDTGKALYRLMVAESKSMPDVTASFYTAGPAKGLMALSSYFQTLSKKKVLAIDNANYAAMQFIGMIHGELMVKAIFCGDSFKMSKRERDAYVTSAVKRFLVGCTAL